MDNLETPEDVWLVDTSKITPGDIVHYDTIDGKWHLFVGNEAIRPLTDKEAAEVIWGGTTVPPVM